jgi:predicted TPR repeat methyltransferase
MNDTFDRARQHFLDGVAHFEAGRLQEAQPCFEAELALVPGRTSTLLNLAITHARLGRAQEALPLLEQLLAAEPQQARAWFWHARALQRLGRPDDALASYERALAIDPDLVPAWTNRGGLLMELGRRDEAAGAFREAIAHGGDEALHAYYLAAMTGENAPRTPPREYVQQLFDDYAERFDAHLVGELGYRAHHVLVEPLRALGRFRCALDLGCGTGLCGPLVRTVAERVDGVDLSAPMLEKARALGVYERLEQADLAQHLEHTAQRHDLVLAADVFIYVGALEAVFAGVQRVLEPGGVFCFSLEEAGGELDVELRASLRYAHSRRYVQRLAAQSGLQVLRIESQPIRADQQASIAGLYAWLRK